MQDRESGTIEIDAVERMAVKVEEPQKRRSPFRHRPRFRQGGPRMEAKRHAPQSRRDVPDQTHRAANAIYNASAQGRAVRRSPNDL